MLKRRLMIPAFVAGSLVLGAGGTAWADHPAPGSEFGEHVAEMAQEQAADEGADFGACVSAMATGAGCPHHET